jgi:hypothetical protein
MAPLIGAQEPRRVRARRCSWCQGWISLEDELAASQGAAITHTICPKCEADFDRENADVLD